MPNDRLPSTEYLAPRIVIRLDQFEPGVAPRRALWEPIVETLRRAIIVGELLPDVHLEEPALAQKFGVSRIPIREAIVRLANEGLVRLEPRRGAFVVGVGEDDIQDIYELRVLLESRAIRRAAERIDSDGIFRLGRLIDEMHSAIQRGAPELMSTPDLEFHRQIMIVAESRQLLSAWERTAGLISTILSITDTTYSDLPQAVNGHRELLHALAQHDGDAAETSLREHLSNGESVMREVIRSARRELVMTR